MQKQKEEASKRKKIANAMKSPTSSQAFKHSNPEIQEFLDDENKLNEEENSKWSEISYGEEEWKDLENIFAETSELVKRSGVLVQESARTSFAGILKSRRIVFYAVLYALAMIKLHHKSLERKKLCILVSNDAAAVAGLSCALLLSGEMRTCTICTRDPDAYKFSQILRQRHRVMTLKRRIDYIRNQIERGGEEEEEKEEEPTDGNVRIVRCKDMGCTSRAAEQSDIVMIFEWSVANEEDAEQIVESLDVSCVCVFRDERRPSTSSLCNMLKSSYVSYNHGDCGTLSAGISLVMFCRQGSSPMSTTSSTSSNAGTTGVVRQRVSVWDKRFGGTTCPSFGDSVGDNS